MVEPGQLCTDAQAAENLNPKPYSSVAHVQFDAAFLADKPRATLLWHRSNCGDATRFYGMHVRTRDVAALRGVEERLCGHAAALPGGSGRRGGSAFAALAL